MALFAMQLDAMLERCERLEERVAALYRSYAALSRAEPVPCALWTALAREEEDHARSIALARHHLEPTAGWRTWLEGWDESLAEVEDRLVAGEQLGAEASTDHRLSAALELEMTELEGLRHVVIAAAHERCADGPDSHAIRLVEAVERLSDDPHIRLQAALLKARTRLNKGA
jgi:hypothetical protein